MINPPGEPPEPGCSGGDAGGLLGTLGARARACQCDTVVGLWAKTPFELYASPPSHQNIMMFKITARAAGQLEMCIKDIFIPST